MGNAARHKIWNIPGSSTLSVSMVLPEALVRDNQSRSLMTAIWKLVPLISTMITILNSSTEPTGKHRGIFPVKDNPSLDS